MKLYFIRHGETDWNRKRKIQGQTDNPLNQTGRQEAREASACLKCVSFDAAYCSPLIRARETAEIILENRTCLIKTDNRLIEISYGCREGQSLRLIQKIPFLRLYNFFHHTEKYVPPSGGETIHSLIERCREFLEEMAEQGEKEKNVLTAAHGALIRGMICAAEGLDVKDFWKGNDQKNCSVTILEYKDGRFQVTTDAASCRTWIEKP